MRKQVKLLEEEPVLPAVGLERRRIRHELVAIDRHGAAVGRFQATEHPQQRAFSAARRADQHQHPSGFNRQQKAVERAGLAVSFR